MKCPLSPAFDELDPAARSDLATAVFDIVNIWPSKPQPVPRPFPKAVLQDNIHCDCSGIRHLSMSSPSQQLMEQSILGIDGPPSSPFVTEIDTHSRSPSKQWNDQLVHRVTADHQDVGVTELSPQKPGLDRSEDKENVPQVQDTTSPKLPGTPQKPSTPEAKSTTATDRRPSSDSDLMPPPPPSHRKVSASAKKTPLKSSRSTATIPKSLSRATSREGLSTQDVSTFQAGLDICDRMMPQEDQTNVDETCFSTFSEIPDMTIFAKLGQSPTKRFEGAHTPRGVMSATPRSSRKRPSISRSPSPTPRRLRTPAATANGDETTSFLIDFTQQIEGTTASRPHSSTKSATESNLLSYLNNQRSPNKQTTAKAGLTTPSKSNSLLNLLDFELPPAPTPRSVPTITVRELESLKSSYLSQISSLKATLSGREAEVESLKKAVGDAERRVGEAQEALRDERSTREHVEQEVASWKKRGQEFESMLKSVKEEVIKGEADKEEVNRQLEDTQKRVEDAEARAVKAEERFADALAARGSGNEGRDANAVEEQVQRLVAAQIDAKIEAVSRELHGVYKEKHERKVATLKKSYEARSEKKTAELHTRLTELEKSNEELQAVRDATFSGPVGDTFTLNDSDYGDLKAQLGEQQATLARLQSEVETSHAQQEQLMHDLKQERIEKGNLVLAVEEILTLQADAPPSATPRGMRAISVVEDFRKSMSRPPPVAPRSLAGESKIGRSLPQPQSSSLAHSRNASGGAGKSRILANIERMGRTGSGSGTE